MKRLIYATVVVSALGLSAEELPRNPFWPNGYEGPRYPITTEPRFKPKPKVKAPSAATVAKKQVIDARAKADEAERAKEAERLAKEEAMWRDARWSLKFGGTMGYELDGRQCRAIVINGRTYSVGDLVSRNLGDVRFTWKVEDITPEGKIKLQRIKFSTIKTEQSL